MELNSKISVAIYINYLDFALLIINKFVTFKFLLARLTTKNSECVLKDIYLPFSFKTKPFRNKNSNNNSSSSNVQ